MNRKFGWHLEFTHGKNVSVPLEDVITNDKYSLGLKKDTKSEHFLSLQRLSTVQTQAEFNI